MRRAIFAGFVVGFVLALAADAGARDRNKATALKRQADQLLSDGKHKEGEAAYKQAIAADRGYLPAYEALSLHYLRKQRFKATAQLLGQVLRDNPRFAEGWYNLAYALRKLGRHDKAIKAYRRNAQLKPDSADPHYGIGLSLKAQHKKKQAAASFRRYAALEMRPNRKAWIEKALAMADRLAPATKKARPTPAAPPATVAAKPKKAWKPGGGVPPVLAPARPAAAKARPAAAKPAPTTAAPRPAATPSPSGPISAERRKALRHKQAGDAALQAGRAAEATAHYRRAIAVDYTYHAAYDALGNALFRLKRYKDATRVFRIAIRDNPDYHLGWYNLAYALRKSGQLPASIAAYKKYARRRPQASDVHFGLGLAYEALGQKQQAVDAFNRYITIERRPTQKRWVDKARQHVTALGGAPAMAAARPAPRQRKLTRAELRRQKIAERKRKREEARQQRLAAKRQRAEARRQKLADRKRKREEARQQRLAAKRQRAETRRQKLADSKRARQQARAAKQLAAAAGKRGARPASGAITPPLSHGVATGVEPAEDRPTPIPAPVARAGTPRSKAERLTVQGDTLARANKCREAMPRYRQALAADPFAVEAYDGIAYCAYRTGDYPAGTRRLSIGLRDNPDYARGWLHLARLQRLAGKEPRAVGAYRKYLQRARPADPSARFELARALRKTGLKQQAVSAYRSYLQSERRDEQQPRRQRAAAAVELRALGGSLAGLGAIAAAAPAGPRGAAGLKPPTLSPAERRRQARLEAKHKREAARQARAEKTRLAKEARAEKVRLAKEARAEKVRLAREARAEKIRLAKEAREAKRATRQTARQRKTAAARRRALDRAEDARIAKLARKRPGKGTAAAGAAIAAVLDSGLPPARQGPPRDVLKPAPKAAAGMVAIADRLFAKRRYLVALGIYRQAARLDAGATEPLYKAGVCAVALGRMHLASDLFERVLQRDPTNATAAVNLKMARAAADASKPPASYHKETLAQTERDLQQGHYGIVERRLGRLGVGKGAGRLFALRAAARLGLGKTEQALSDAGRALALAPADPRPLELLGDTHRQLGQARKARYYYRLFLARAGEQPRAADVRRKLLELAAD